MSGDYARLFSLNILIAQVRAAQHVCLKRRIDANLAGGRFPRQTSASPQSYFGPYLPASPEVDF